MGDKNEECLDIENCGEEATAAVNSRSTGAAGRCNSPALAVRPRGSTRKLIRRIVIMSILVSVLVALSALVYYYMGWISLVQLLLVAIVAYVIAGKKYEWFIVALRTLPRDVV